MPPWKLNDVSRYATGTAICSDGGIALHASFRPDCYSTCYAAMLWQIQARASASVRSEALGGNGLGHRPSLISLLSHAHLNKVCGLSPYLRPLRSNHYQRLAILLDHISRKWSKKSTSRMNQVQLLTSKNISSGSWSNGRVPPVLMLHIPLMSMKLAFNLRDVAGIKHSLRFSLALSLNYTHVD